MIATIYFKENYSKFIIIYATENFVAVILGWLFALAKRFFYLSILPYIKINFKWIKVFKFYYFVSFGVP